MNPYRERRADWLLAAALGAVVALVFLPVTGFDFLGCWDDHTYILKNQPVRDLDAGRLATGYVLGNYHPLTMFSYALQYRLFGDRPAGYHAVSLFLHVINCLLVFWLARLLGRKRLVAVLAAVLFGLHPLRVEPVAWISAQKDLIAAAGILVMMIAYCRYRAKGRRSMLLASVLAFTLAALAKATVVLMPLLLPFIDRLLPAPDRPGRYKVFIPYVIIGAALGITAVFARASYQSQLGEAAMPVALTAATAVLRLVYYFGGRIFLPDTGVRYLDVHMLVRSGIPLVPLLAGLGIVLVLAAAVVISRKSNGRILFGAVFFSAAILPAMPAMNLGSSADRFTYLASIGILYAVAEYIGWCADSRSRLIRFAVIGTAVAAVITLSWGTRARLPKWKDCPALTGWFTQLHPDDPTAWMNRGLAHAERLDNGPAVEYYGRSLALNPGYALVYNLRGLVRSRRDPAGALDDFTRAVTIDPRYAEAWYNRGNLHYDRNRLAEAAADYTRAIELDATHAEIYFNRGNCRARLGDYRGAIDDYTGALRLDPGHRRALFNRARSFFAAGQYRSALTDVFVLQEQGVPVDPAFVDTLNDLLR